MNGVIGFHLLSINHNNLNRIPAPNAEVLVVPNPVVPKAGADVAGVPNKPVEGCDVAPKPNPGVAGLKVNNINFLEMVLRL